MSREPSMTLSDAHRIGAMDTALRRMYFDLGDAPLGAICFEVRAERFRDLPDTTWLELQSAGHVEPMHAMGNPGFRLTGRGWIAALKSVGEYDAQRDHVIALSDSSVVPFTPDTI